MQLKNVRVIRTVWRFEGCDLFPQPVQQYAWLKFGGIVAVEHADLGRESAEDVLCLLLRSGAQSYLVLPRRLRQRGRKVLVDGRPVLGGIAELKHGTWLTLAVGDARERMWLSSEGPAFFDRAGPDEYDAMTLDRTTPGATVVRCACGAAFETRTWSELRRCCSCAYVEDGIYHDVPSAASLAAGGRS